MGTLPLAVPPETPIRKGVLPSTPLSLPLMPKDIFRVIPAFVGISAIVGSKTAGNLASLKNGPARLPRPGPRRPATRVWALPDLSEHDRRPPLLEPTRRSTYAKRTISTTCAYVVYRELYRATSRTSTLRDWLRSAERTALGDSLRLAVFRRTSAG